MKIKDIVNREIVNLTNCEHEPIHIPGSIQPHGFLISLDARNYQITFCSSNCGEFIGRQPGELLGKQLREIFGDNAFSGFEKYVERGLMLSSTPLRISVDDRAFSCTVHRSGEQIIIEGEPATSVSDTTFYDQTTRFLSYMNDTHTLQQLCQLVANGTREITGYDRVMIYRFDEQYNGEVFAESVREDLEPFLGLHYPHTDIPVQARELYLQNLLRLIVDINYTPVPLLMIDVPGNANLDLGRSVLRSTSPIHIEYLQNMGVGATLTISLIYQKKLWGLIACHHYSPKNLPPEIRLAAQLQGHFITSQIDVRQSNEEYAISKRTQQAMERLNSTLKIEDNADFDSLVQSPEILEICGASGVSIIFEDAVYRSGITPSDIEIKTLSGWLYSHTVGSSLTTEKLAAVLPADYAQSCGDVSGIIYHSLGKGTTNSIIWYRPETVTEVNWAGDPSKAIVKNEKGLSPRKSFELWKEKVKCQSRAWLQPEISTAASYAHSLQKQMHLILLTEKERHNNELNHVLQQSNSELENINWISTHDLQEPLRKIQLIASRIMTREGEFISDNVLDSLKRMNNAANRMQTLLIDILKYTKIQHTNESFETVDPESVLREVFADLNEAINERSAVINLGKLPAIYAIPILLQQLFSNLITNSLKYSKPDVAPEITIIGAQQPETVSFPGNGGRLFTKITFTDNGIGFKPEFSESIFNIFTRLHGQTEYKGSGVGLALCRKIMQNHKGFITASGVLGQGAVFTLYFPVKPI